MTNRKLGNHYIKAWRKFRHLSLRALAERMEYEPGIPVMSHANIARIEKGEQAYTEESLQLFSEALNCSITDLLTIDPYKDGDVVDLWRVIDEKNRAQAIAILKAISTAA